MKKEKLMIVTPQFERPKEWPKVKPPQNTETFIYAIENFTEEQLASIGFCRWEEETNLMLIPGNCYGLIPKGFEVTTISGKTEKFVFGKTDNDIRFGCLPYGIYPKSKLS
jgi:hypothetical protein